MRTLLLFLSLFILTGCKESTQPKNTPQKPSEAPTEASVAQLKEEHVAADFANLLAPLIDPAIKLIFYDLIDRLQPPFSPMYSAQIRSSRTFL